MDKYNKQKGIDGYCGIGGAHSGNVLIQANEVEINGKFAIIANGEDGEDGTDGKNGTPGVIGADGIDGYSGKGAIYDYTGKSGVDYNYKT